MLSELGEPSIKVKEPRREVLEEIKRVEDEDQSQIHFNIQRQTEEHKLDFNEPSIKFNRISLDESRRYFNEEEIRLQRQKITETQGKVLSQLYQRVEDEELLDIYVKNPTDYNGHIVYDVKGVDKDGIFDGRRRYNDFLAFRNLLVTRFPGLCIPRIPPKKAIGNKEFNFLQERMCYLDRFLKKVCTNPMIYQSDEMFFFSRPTGTEVGKAIERVQRLTFAQKLEKIIQMTNVNMELY
mmetsp:Transcript_48352/g.35540  ORF Transcript_48352/g.35540 Transcript_48352/m.35540 type:complete len:238 (-) Transcript_48352:225-938(-)